MTRSIRLTPIDDQLIETIGDRIRSVFRPEAIYLFGSAAAGTTKECGDVDVLVVMDVPADTDEYQMAGRIRRIFDGWLVAFDIIVQTPKDFESGKRLPGNISRKAAGGRLLYER